MQEDKFSAKVTIVTHSGSFHPDDVFSVAALLILFESRAVFTRVERSRDPAVAERGDFVVDVGAVYDQEKNRFDHHQAGGAGERGNGVPYASFGLVWRKFGEAVVGSREAADVLDRGLVQFIDAMDNGVGEILPVMADVFPYSIGRAILAFNPGWSDSRPDYDQAFSDAVNFAVAVLRREIRVVTEKLSGEKAVKKIYDETTDKRLMVLDKKYPWEEVLSKLPEPLFVVAPHFEASGDIRFGLEAVRDNPHSFVNRLDLPANWAGKRDEELVVATGVADAVFCHNQRFFAVAKSKEGAVALARLALTHKVNI